jgi:hypothetical protein
MARLTWRGESADSLGITFAREGHLTGKRALRHMRRVSKIVLQTAIEWSPVDYKGKTRNSLPLHELEKSHRLVEEYGSNRRLEAHIEVGGMVGDVDVDLYAMWIHDGSYERGPATIAKGPNAGPGWLERAMDEHADDFEPLLDDLLEGLLR